MGLGNIRGPSRDWRVGAYEWVVAMSFPKRKPRQRSGIRDMDGPIKCPAHMQHVRGFSCLIEGMDGHICAGRIEAHHVKTRGAGGGDDQVVPLCSTAHSMVHTIGHDTFEKRFKLNMLHIAEHLWTHSPAGRKYRFTHDVTHKGE